MALQLGVQLRTMDTQVSWVLFRKKRHVEHFSINCFPHADAFAADNLRKPYDNSAADDFEHILSNNGKYL